MDIEILQNFYTLYFEWKFSENDFSILRISLLLKYSVNK